jgi:hypothetical protein
MSRCTTHHYTHGNTSSRRAVWSDGPGFGREFCVILLIRLQFADSCLIAMRFIDLLNLNTALNAVRPRGSFWESWYCIMLKP